MDVDITTVRQDYSSREGRGLIHMIRQEPSHPLGERIAIRKGIRYERKLFPVHLSAVESNPFRKNGVYFILGGAGGIGLELSSWLAENVQAKIILVGRSGLDIQKKAKIAAIESRGGEVLYLQADATNLKSMKDAVAQAKTKFGKIHGAIHSAIVLKDKLLDNMDETTLLSALDTKVRGSVILHQAFKEESLDFMLFFSSALSFSGNAGQTNYAAGCTFKDAYAQALKHNEKYPAKVINWGYWGTVGIVASEDYNKRLAASGLYSIEPSQGMEAIQRILAHPLEQVVPINANQDFMKGMHVDFNSKILLPLEENSSVMDAAFVEKKEDLFNRKVFNRLIRK